MDGIVRGCEHPYRNVLTTVLERSVLVFGTASIRPKRSKD